MCQKLFSVDFQFAVWYKTLRVRHELDESNKYLKLAQNDDCILNLKLIKIPSLIVLQ